MGRIEWDNLGFDIQPADRMLVAQWKDGRWDGGKILDYGPLPVYPSAAVLNYGQGVFEGLKAYHTRDGRITLFRPRENARRMNDGCRRLCMPEIDEDFFVDRLIDLLRENREFVPPYGKGSLYVRPLLFGSGQVLGVQPAPTYTFAIFMSPVGPYFKGGFAGIRLQIRCDYQRAPLHGTGSVKAIGNYATSLLPRIVVKERGFQEVIYLDSRCATYVEEVGAANFFLIRDGVLSTPRLGGSILPGITRMSVMELARRTFSLTVQERDVRYDELFSADELFCTGTAAVITPITLVSYEGEDHTIGDGSPGRLSTRLFEELEGIQLGDRPDAYDWIVYVD
jgi:branched-chain amino acid aminotransferase